MMGWVAPTSVMEALKSPDPLKRQAAARQHLEGYNRYRAGMREGVFGLIIGRAMFPESKDRKL